MRVLYLHQYFRTPEQAGGTRSFEFARRLAAYGHDVHMVTTDNEGSGWRRFEVEGFTVHSIGISYSNTLSYAQRILAFLRFIGPAARRGLAIRPDVVFATSTPLTIAIPAIAVSLLRHKNLIFEVRDAWPEIPIQLGVLRNPVLKAAALLLERFAYGCSSRIVALSPGMVDSVVRTGFPRERVAMIPNSSDNSLFATGGRTEDWTLSEPWTSHEHVVTYTGTLGYANGGQYLVDLAHALLKTNRSIAIAVFGEGSEYEHIRTYAGERGVLGVNFCLFPSVSKSSIPEILRASDACIATFISAPILESNSANKFFDYLAAGKPIFLNYGGWQSEILEKNGAGMRLARTDFSCAASDLEAKVTDREWLSLAGKAARHLAVEEFDRDKLAHRLADVIDRGANERVPLRTKLKRLLTVLLHRSSRL